MPETTHEMLAREKKAHNLAAALRKAGVTVAEAKALTDADWLYVVKGTRHGLPSQATKDLVIRMLEQAGA